MSDCFVEDFVSMMKDNLEFTNGNKATILDHVEFEGAMGKIKDV